MQGITAVQVRRDLMLIGFSSDTKKGYDVEVLIDFINGILDSPTPMNIAVIGMGHLPFVRPSPVILTARG